MNQEPFEEEFFDISQIRAKSAIPLEVPVGSRARALARFTRRALLGKLWIAGLAIAFTATRAALPPELEAWPEGSVIPASSVARVLGTRSRAAPGPSQRASSSSPSEHNNARKTQGLHDARHTLDAQKLALVRNARHRGLFR